MKTKKKILSVLGILTIFFLICLIYAHYEYTQLKVRTIEIASKDIPQENCVCGGFSAGYLCEI